MSRPSVSVEGDKHMTGAEKRTVLAIIEHLRPRNPETWADLWMGLKRSPKSYNIAPDHYIAGRFSVSIKTPHRNDQGKRREQTAHFYIRVSGIDPVSSPQAKSHSTTSEKIK